MLATEWTAPGAGATVEELLAVSPSYIIDGYEWSRLKRMLPLKTSLSLIPDRTLQPYDRERIEEALRRMIL